MAAPRAGELVSQLKSRDYSASLPPLYDEASVALELARNGMLPFFSNSFLAFAGKTAIHGAEFDQLAYLVSSSRRPLFRTRTRIVDDGGGRLRVEKQPLAGGDGAQDGPVALRATESPWLDTVSLHTTTYLRARGAKRSLADIFTPCAAWVAHLQSLATLRDGVAWLDGNYVDCTWHNVFPEGAGFAFVDREWTWHQDIRLPVIVIRAIYYFLARTEDQSGISRQLARRSGRALITEIATGLGVTPRASDFDDFVELESGFQSVAFGVDKARYRAALGWFLTDRTSLKAFRTCRRFALRVRASAEARLGISLGGRS
jgi:hypothetical protein